MFPSKWHEFDKRNTVKMELLSFILSSLLILATCTIFLRNNIKRKRLPPGPYGLPIIGSFASIVDRPHESLANLAKSYGPLMTVKFGLVNVVIVSSKELANEILRKNDQTFLGRPISQAITGEKDYESAMTWISGSPQWRKLRKLCNSQIFTPQRLDNHTFQNLRHQMMCEMVQYVSEKRSVGDGVYIGRLVFGIMLKVLSNTLFSLDMFDLKSDKIDELKMHIGNIMDLLGKPNVSDNLPFLKTFDLQGIKRNIKKSYDQLHELVGEIIDQRMKSRSCKSYRTGDFLDVLIDCTEAQGPEALIHQEVTLLLMELFIGGTDTTTTTVEWVMAELLHNPAILAGAKQELQDKIVLGKSVQEQDIYQLPYLDAIIKETLRLHPTIPFLLPHRSEEEVEVSGYTIPKHTKVFVNAWTIFRDPAYWDEPTVFKPERFMTQEFDYRGKDFSFIPFGAGRRICPGLNLAVRMVSLIVANLVHNFDWKLPNGMTPQELNMSDKFGVALHKVEPLLAIPA